jgi:membrane protease subunit HflK
VDLRLKAAVTTISVNVALVAFKIFLSRISGSASIHADAWHSISDLMVSGFVLISLTVTTTSEKRNRLINWKGLEDIVALVVGLFILYTGWAIFRNTLVHPAGQIRNVGWVLAGAVLCAFSSFSVSSIEMKVGRTKNSPCLVADAYHSRMDMYSTIAVIIGLFGVAIGIDLDRPAAGVVAILIALTGLEIIVGSARAIIKGTAVSDYFLSAVLERGFGFRPGAHGQGAAHTGLAWLRRTRRYAYFGIGAILLLWVASGMFIIRHGETGIVFRFGRISRAGITAGIHYHVPVPVETLTRIPTSAIRRTEIGFRTVADTTKAERIYDWESRHETGGYVKILDESLIITGDENIIDANAVIHYRVRQPVKYVLNLEAPAELVHSLGEISLRRILGTMPIDGVLTTDRAKIEEMVFATLQGLLDGAGSGIEVVSVKLQDVHPPTEVVDAFREVSSAREDMSRLINEAEAYRDSLLPDVRGQAAQMVGEAQAQQKDAVEHASGEAARFLAVAEQYHKAKDVTSLRLYLESVETALPQAEKLIVEPKAGGEPIDLRFFDEKVQGTKGGW